MIKIYKNHKPLKSTKYNIKKKKYKNPYYFLYEKAELILEDFGSNIKFDYLANGSFAETYTFVIKDSNKLRPGKYLLKILKREYFKDSSVKRLKDLSKLGLIPKINYIGDDYLIMKYIPGITVYEWLKQNHSSSEKEEILDKIESLLQKWHKLKYSHNDLHIENVLITATGKLYLIDPAMENNRYDPYRDFIDYDKIMKDFK